MRWDRLSLCPGRQVQRSKETTARVVVHRELGIVNSFTLEATLAGPNFGRFGGTHLLPSTLRSVGHSFCDTILDYFDPDPQKREAVAEELRLLYPQARAMPLMGGISSS